MSFPLGNNQKSKGLPFLEPLNGKSIKKVNQTTASKTDIETFALNIVSGSSRKNARKTRYSKTKDKTLTRFLETLFYKQTVQPTSSL
jgi:hypothetical protein